MINYTYESLFRQDSIDKQLEITGTGISLGNADIFQNSFELTEELNTGDDLTFGSYVSSCLKFTTSAIGSSFIGKTLTVKLVVDGHTGSKFTFGTYKVVEEKWTANRTKKEITAYDSLYEVSNKDVTSWYNGLTFPITLKNFRNSFFSYVGITQKSVTLINDSMSILNSIAPSKLSGGEVIRAICEINGCFGHIGRNNRFEYKELSATPVYTITPSMYSECIYEDYSTTPIDRVIIRQEENDIGGQAGAGDNELIIQGNFLVYGNETSIPSIAQIILNSVSTISYVPAEIKVIGNPCVEVGDLVTITKKDGTTFNSYVLSRKLVGTQAMKDEYSSSGNETRINAINTYDNEGLQLLGKTNVLTRTLDGTISQVGDLSNSVTTLSQTADSIQLQVDSLQQQVDGETQYYERNGVPTLLNYPYWDFTSAIPCNNTIRLDEIYTKEMAEGGDKFPHFYYSEKDRKDHLRALCVNLNNGNGYRFVQEEGVWHWKEIADSDWSILYNRISEVEITVDGIEANVSDMEADLSSLDNRVTTNATNINITSSAITAEVTRATTAEGNLNSSISSLRASLSMTASGITSWVEENYPTNTALATTLEDYQTTSGMSSYQTVSGMSLYWTATTTQAKINQSASSITTMVTANYVSNSSLSTTLHDYQTTSGMSSYWTSAQTRTAITQTATSITTEVSTNYLGKTGGSSSTFGWNLTDSKFELKSNSNTVFKCDSNGVQVNGEIRATSGFIGQNTTNGFTITNNAIYNGVSSISDVSNNGIFLGKSGIALGKGMFKVTNAGALTARSGYIGDGSNGFTITDTAIYNGVTSISDTTNEGVYIGTDGIKTKNFLLLPSGYMSYNRGLIGSAEKGFWINEDGNGYEYLRSGLLSIDDTLHDGVYLGANGIALGKGKFKITNEGKVTATSGNLGGWDFSQNGYLRIYNNNEQVASIYGGTNGDLQFSSKDITNYSRTFEVNVGSPQGSQSEGIVSFSCSGGAHEFIVNMADIILNGDVAINYGKITNTNQHLTLFASSEQDYSAELGVQDSKWAFMPSVNGKLYLGTQNHKWDTVYAQTGTINTSDRREKENIEELDTEISDFVLKLKPVSYKFKVGERTHFGLIAQDVEEVMKEIGWTDKDFAGFCKDGDSYGLRYEEFISPLIKVVQDQQKEIETLKSEIAEIKKLLKGV